MNDDIVTRLRTKYAGQLFICNEAADEIERLRTELKRWQNCEMLTESICGWDSEQTYCDTCKAVRDE